MSSNLLLPGLCDLQVNGFCGIDFNSSNLTCQDVDTVCRRLVEEYVVAFLPTIITNDPKTVEHLLRTITEAVSRQNSRQSTLPYAKIAGIHLEGPFISPHDGPRGAHPPKWVRPPDLDWVKQLQKMTNGMIRLVTLAPEWPDSSQFIENLRKMDIHVAIGHTAATDGQIIEAVSAGATLSTHLGNGIAAMLPRHPNPIWSQLAEERLFASFIGDGFHLPREVIQVFQKLKKEKLFLVSDSTQFAGLPPGNYTSPIGGDVTLRPDGRVFMSENPQLLAGSAMSLWQMICKISQSKITTFDDAWEMGSVRPWNYLGLPGFPKRIHVPVFPDMTTLPENNVIL